MGTQEDYDALKRLHDSVNRRVTQLENENNTLKGINQVLVNEKKQWEDLKVVQEGVIKNHLNSSDKTVQRLQDEIQDIHDEKRELKRKVRQLEAENKRLKDGNIN